MKKFLVLLMSVSLLCVSAQAIIVDASLVTHLEADSLGLADGAAVSSWTDLSGLGNHATQGTSGLEPVYVASSAAFNSHATVKFDGTDDFMDMVDAVNVGSFTLFLVGKLNANGSDQYFVSGYDAGLGGNNRFRIAEYGWSNYMKFRVGATDMTSTVKTKDTDTHMFAMNSVAEVWHDGDPAASSSNTQTNTPDIRLGSIYGTDGFLNGEIAEVVLYDRVLSTAETTQIMNELNTKYAVPEPATMILLGLGAVMIRRRRA
jgi:hypothetical protein